MVEKTDLPVGSRIGKFFFEPVQLLGIEVIAIERKEMNIALFEGIILLAVHVEEFVKALVGVVVIPERRVKLDAGIQQRLVRESRISFVSRLEFCRRRCCRPA